MTIRVSTFSLSRWIPASAWTDRRRPSKPNGRVDHADGERAERLGDLGDDRRPAGPGATALAGGDEHHVRALQDLFDLLPVLLGGGPPHFGVAPRAESPGELAADVELHVGIAHQQGLGVGVDGDELDALQAGVDHAVHRVDASAADADDLDDGDVVLRSSGHVDPPGYNTRSAHGRLAIDSGQILDGMGMGWAEKDGGGNGSVGEVGGSGRAAIVAGVTRLGHGTAGQDRAAIHVQPACHVSRSNRGISNRNAPETLDDH